MFKRFIVFVLCYPQPYSVCVYSFSLYIRSWMAGIGIRALVIISDVLIWAELPLTYNVVSVNFELISASRFMNVSTTNLNNFHLTVS